MSLVRTLEARRPRLRSRTARSVVGNVGARLTALVSVAAVTVLVARSGGAGDVGLLALMRVLPGLVGVVAACGLPGAMGFFVAGPDGAHARLWPTILTAMLAGAALGTAGWLVLTPVVHDHLMATTSSAVVAVTGLTVATQLPVAVGKSCLQALDDPRGSNVVTAAEEAAYLPAYGLLWLWGLRGGWLLVTALLVADVVVAAHAWVRIRRRVRARGGTLLGRPDAALGRRMAAFGLRSQVGGILNLLNLRLDVVILGALTGPAQVGVYVVASKYAELLRLPGLALTWVTYPQFARRGSTAGSTDESTDGSTDGAGDSAEHADDGARDGIGADPHIPSPDRLRMPGRPVGVSSRRPGRHRAPRRLLTLPRLLALGIGGGIVLAASAFVVLPFVYGDEFEAAVWPAVWISLGLVVEPAAGVASGFLLGSGRPGLNSLILGGGFVVTLVLDVLLIPRHGSLGAAWASMAAYLVADIMLVRAWRRGPRGVP